MLYHFLAQYRSDVSNNSLGIVEGRLVIYEPVSTTVNQICRIVVPISLRHLIFSLLHASPVAGHMGEYKTIYCIRLRSFWPKMRSNIHRWIKQCPHCQLTFRWRSRFQELIFSWPLISPLVIIHIDIWVPGKYTDSKGNMTLMNAMCDIS